MKTPIYDFLKAYKRSGISRFHMPGHKGRNVLGVEGLDITEIGGADVLYSARGIIAESEENATRLFNTGHTFYSTEGSTLAIKAMLALATRGKGNRPVLAARNIHKAFVYAAAELDLAVEWISSTDTEHICSCRFDKEGLRTAINGLDSLPSAVYLTSPDYLGNMLDIRALAEICREKDIPLLVDNAHGAYLAFCEPSLHPIALGAAMCCDSAHKTLPVLTGGAYLHISKDYPEYKEMAREVLSIFASTSPSYLTLASLDLCNRELDSNFRKKLAKCKERVTEVKRLLGCGEDTEPLKITIDTGKIHHTGDGVTKILRNHRIEYEYSDNNIVVLMASPSNTRRDFRRLTAAVREIITRGGASPASEVDTLMPLAERAISIREAVFAPQEWIDVRDAVGRISALPTVSCPPAVPIVVSGERIDESIVKLLLANGTYKILVVKE